MYSTLAQQIHDDGFAILEDCFTPNQVAHWQTQIAKAIEESNAPGRLQTTVDDQKATYGSRNLLAICPQVVEFLSHPSIADVCGELLGTDYGVVRGLYFDKPPGATWSLPWHQDLTIAVAEHVVSENVQPLATEFADGFTKPTVKAGICHVEAPTSILQRMLTVRIHLDAMQANNGPVVVRKGSHRAGKLVQGERPSKDEITQVHCRSGSVMFMMPLLSHSSIVSQPDCVEHRRTVHLELSPDSILPCGYRWHSYVAC